MNVEALVSVGEWETVFWYGHLHGLPAIVPVSPAIQPCPLAYDGMGRVSGAMLPPIVHVTRG